MIKVLNKKVLKGITVEFLLNYQSDSNISTWLVITKDSNNSITEKYEFKYRDSALEYYDSLLLNILAIS